MKIYKEEIFGPVLMMTTETYEEALNLVNDHELGNGAAVFTKVEILQNILQKMLKLE